MFLLLILGFPGSLPPIILAVAVDQGRAAAMAPRQASRGWRETAAARRDDCYPLLASDWQQDSWLRAFPGRTAGVRLAVLTMVMVVTCCGVCVALLHPHRAGDFMITVRRCLFGGSGGNGHPR